MQATPTRDEFIEARLAEHDAAVRAARKPEYQAALDMIERAFAHRPQPPLTGLYPLQAIFAGMEYAATYHGAKVLVTEEAILVGAPRKVAA